MNNKLLLAMIQYFRGDARRIQHFVKVYEFAKLIGEKQGLDKGTQYILETAAIVHDIGIKMAEEKYGRCNGKLQEQEGPAEAEKLLESLGYERDVIHRVSYLVGQHHTYSNVDGLDYRILLEADFLVNLYEDGLDKKGIQNAYDRVFRTDAGRRICRDMFGL